VFETVRECKKRVMKRLNLIKGIVLLIFSLIVCYESNHLSLWSGRKPGPGLFPLFLGILLGILSLVFIIVKGFKQNKEAIPLWTSRGNRNRILLTFGTLIIYAIVLPFFGFLVSTFFLLFFLLGLSYSGKWIVLGISSFLISFAFYIIFQILLKIQLPHGILGI
jgi:putative tricarboxylic transport membrane protein